MLWVQPRAVEVILPGEEDLRLVLQPAEGRAVDDAVAVDLEQRAILAGEAAALGQRGRVEGGVEAVGGHGGEELRAESVASGCLCLFIARLALMEGQKCSVLIAQCQATFIQTEH